MNPILVPLKPGKDSKSTSNEIQHPPPKQNIVPLPHMHPSISCEKCLFTACYEMEYKIY